MENTECLLKSDLEISVLGKDREAELGRRKLSYNAAHAVNVQLINGSCGARTALQICPNLDQDDQTFIFPH